MIAEGAHEAGRAGAIRAKRLLQQLLGDGLDLSFNAYDHASRLAFRNVGPAEDSFQFDLGGALKRKNADRFDHQEAVDVFVEVKTRTEAGDLLAEYREFLRRAATVSADPRYSSAWFIFFSTVPLGCSKAAELANGTLIRDTAKTWPLAIQSDVNKLHDRIVLVIATESFARLVSTWGRHAA